MNTKNHGYDLSKFFQFFNSNLSDKNLFNHVNMLAESDNYIIPDNLILTVLYNLPANMCVNYHDLMLVAVHVLMLELGYLPIFKKTPHIQSPADGRRDTKNFPNNYVLPSGWNNDNGFYNLSYWHPASESLYCKLVCVPVNDSLIIHTMIEGDDIISDQSHINTIEKDNDDEVAEHPQTTKQKIEDSLFFQGIFNHLPLLQEDKKRLGYVLSSIFSKSVLSLTLDLHQFIEDFDTHPIELPSPVCADETQTCYTDLGHQLGRRYKNLPRLSAMFKDTLGWPVLYDTMLRNALISVIQANKPYLIDLKNQALPLRKRSSSLSKHVSSTNASHLPEGGEAKSECFREITERASASVLLWIRSVPSYILYTARHIYGLPTFNASALPPEIKVEILIYLTLGPADARHLVRVSGTNREFFALARQQGLWKRLCQLDFPDLAATFPENGQTVNSVDSENSSPKDGTSTDTIDWYVMYVERFQIRAKYAALARARASAAEQGAVRVRRLLPPPIPFHRHPHHRYPPFYPMYSPYGPFNNLLHPYDELRHNYQPHRGGCSSWALLGRFPHFSFDDEGLPNAAYPHRDYDLLSGNFNAMTPGSDLRRTPTALPTDFSVSTDQGSVVNFDDGIVRRPLFKHPGHVINSHRSGNYAVSCGSLDQITIPVRINLTPSTTEIDQLYVVRDRTRALNPNSTALAPLFYLFKGAVTPGTGQKARSVPVTTTGNVEPSLEIEHDSALLNGLYTSNGLPREAANTNLPVSIYYPPEAGSSQNTYISFFP